MQFQLFHKKFFNAVAGSYSIVTEREEYDSQITLTDAESEMVIQYFGRSNIQVGNVASNKSKSQKQFFLYPDMRPIKLNLVFPKPEKHELRLYISSRAGFKPKSGEIWFLFIDKNGQLIIGSFPEQVWFDLDQIDTEDNNYLNEIQEEIKEENLEKKQLITSPKPKIVKVAIGERIIYKRNPLIAVASLTKAKFKCEIDNSHITFIAEKSKLPYVEAHHLIPMKFQSDFNFALDRIENVVSLCPTCHRGIHLGVSDYKRFLIESIYASRTVINNFTIDDLYSFYNLLNLEIETKH
ncbi:MAG: HNH endonuclease [Ginsengibacter sp.]